MRRKKVALMPIHIMGSFEMGVEIRMHQNALESVFGLFEITCCSFVKLY